MARPKKIKPPKINKLKLVERLVEKPAQGIKVWAIKEFSCLKNLEEQFPLEFLNQLKFSKKLPSLAVLSCDWQMRDLKRRYQTFLYIPPKHEEIKLGEKCDKDIEITKKETLRQWL